MAHRIAAILTLTLIMLGAVALAKDDAKADRSGLARLVGPQTPLRKGDSIAFFGDSITMQGGYIDRINAAIKADDATRELGVTSHKHGLNGGRVPTVLEGKSPWGELGGTMAALLDEHKPTVAVIYLGVNDVWHGEKGTTPEDFEAGLNEMADLCRKAGATVVLCTPAVIGEELKDNKLNETLGRYAAITRKIAGERKLVVCDVHAAFIERLAKVNPNNEHQGHLTYDGVHMNDAGNDLLADLIAGSIAHALAARAR